jgi:drug/metabolite transporter (DMT)-like permease
MTAARLWRAAPLLLAAASLFWAGNFVVGRAVHATVPPLGLAFWRWLVSFVLVLGPAWPHLRRDAPTLRRQWRVLLLLAALGVAAYAVLTYLGLQSTTAINALLLQSATPLLIMACAFALFRDPARPLQVLAIAVSLAGVVVIVARGNLGALHALSLNRGDVWVLAGVLCYALYSALLRLRPAVHPLSFLAASFGFGALLLLPCFLGETLAGTPTQPTLPTFTAIGYLAVFPGCLAYLFYNRGVEVMGAGRAGQYFHLMPVFGTVLAVIFLGESFALYQALGIALIAAGIALASWHR